MKIPILHIYNKTPIILKIIVLILLCWFAQILFIYQSVNWGWSWDDWRWLFYYDAHQGNNLSNFFAIKNDIGSIHPLQQTYYIGLLKEVFGFNQAAFQMITLLFKSLAALSIGWLVYRFTKDKIFTFLTIFFFIIFPSTAGLLYILTGLNYLIVVFMSFSIYFYIRSVKINKKEILLSSLFFFLALCAGPARAYILLPIPLIMELVRLKKSFHPFVFLTRLAIFYLPLFLLRSNQGAFDPTTEIFTRLIQINSGNLYTLTLPFQELSTLFIDQHILNNILTFGRSLIPFISSNIARFMILNSFFIIASSFLGFIFKGKQKMYSFVLKTIFPTLVLEIIFYILGQFGIHNGRIAFNDPQGQTYWYAPFDSTIYQASLGGYIFLLGGVLSLEWWESKDNSVQKITLLGWFWAVFSIFLLFITNYRYEMIAESIDRYTTISSVGAIVFVAGIATLSFNELKKIKQIKLKLLLIYFLSLVILVVTYWDYKYMDEYFADYGFNEHQGDSMRMISATTQNIIYKRFLSKFGRDNLTKPAILYIDGEGNIFNQSSFSEPIKYRIYYDENANLIRNNCKIVITDIKELKKAYAIKNGEKGFLYETSCVDPKFGVIGQTVFYPLSNFYAYRIENKEFIDIKDDTLLQLDSISK